MKKTCSPAIFSLALAPLSRTIYAGKVKTCTDGKRTWGEPSGVRHDVTCDFYHVLLNLADMLDESKTNGGFVFNMNDGSAYEVNIKKTKPESKP